MKQPPSRQKWCVIAVVSSELSTDKETRHVFRQRKTGLGPLIALGLTFAFALTPVLSAQQGTTPEPDVEKLWSDLTSKDAGTSARALLAFSSNPDKAIALMQTRLKPVKVDEQAVNKLIMDLGSKTFQIRNVASRELEYLGKYAKGILEKALAKANDAETKARLRILLANIPAEPGAAQPARNLQDILGKPGGVRIQTITRNGKQEIKINGVPIGKLTQPAPLPPSGPPSIWIRAVRAIAVLEHVGTPAAKQILQQMASGEADALPTRAAADALQRLKKTK